MSDLERECKETLKDILEYVDADIKYAEYAQLIDYLENLVKRRGGQ